MPIRELSITQTAPDHIQFWEEYLSIVFPIPYKGTPRPSLKYEIVSFPSVFDLFQ